MIFNLGIRWCFCHGLWLRRYQRLVWQKSGWALAWYKTKSRGWGLLVTYMIHVYQHWPLLLLYHGWFLIGYEEPTPYFCGDGRYIYYIPQTRNVNEPSLGKPQLFRLELGTSLSISTSKLDWGGNFAHGFGYLWIPDPMGTGVGAIFYLWARPPETRRHRGKRLGFIFYVWVTHARPDTYVLANFDPFFNSYTISLDSFVMLTDTKVWCNSNYCW